MARMLLLLLLNDADCRILATIDVFYESECSQKATAATMDWLKGILDVCGGGSRKESSGNTHSPTFRFSPLNIRLNLVITGDSTEPIKVVTPNPRGDPKFVIRPALQLSSTVPI
jgi:hypothetical protein